MLKKPHNQPKTGNIAKVKYFLPSSSENRFEPPHNQQSRLNQIKRSISNKYKASYATSKNNSKRASLTKISPSPNSLHQQINLNDEASFEIVAIRDAQQNSTDFIKPNHKKMYNYPLGQQESNKQKTVADNWGKQAKFGLTSSSQKDNSKILLNSNYLRRISKENCMSNMVKNFPKPEQKDEFERFLQNLKRDENYQNTITMFTMMYFYQQKAKKK